MPTLRRALARLTRARRSFVRSSATPAAHEEFEPTPLDFAQSTAAPAAHEEFEPARPALAQSSATPAAYAQLDPARLALARLTPARLAFAYALDLAVGDPEWFPHPVRCFGILAGAGERCLRPFTRGPGSELLAGAVLTGAVVSVGWALGRPKNAPWQTTMAWTALATRSLLDEARAVILALERGDLPRARRRLARIVGRDTAHLDEAEISRAVIETLAESTCDGIVAPLFWLAAGGTSAALAYKAINTLDSAIGHREPPYLHFGRFAARLDDAANFLPARATALAIALAAASPAAFQIWRRDGRKHASPNAGQCEAAMAGALGVRLGGTNAYDGQAHEGPLLHAEGRPPTARDARAALSLVAVVSAIAFGAALVAIAGRRR